MNDNGNRPANVNVNLFTTVAVTGTGTLTVIANGVSTVVKNALTVTAAVNDVVLVTKVGAQWVAISRVATGVAPVQIEAPPPPKPTTTAGSLVVSPIETRSYRNGDWRTDNDDVYQGQYGGGGNHTGAVFYGTKPRSLTGATVTSATIKVKRISGGIYAPQPTIMRLMTHTTRPGGAPTLGSTTAGPSVAVGESATFTIPDSWAQAMVDGTAGSFAFFDSDGSPYVKFAGRGTWSPAFTLTINWTRSS